MSLFYCSLSQVAEGSAAARERREADYMRIVRKYVRDADLAPQSPERRRHPGYRVIDIAPEIMSCVAIALKRESRDVVGAVSGLLGSLDGHQGQFFTPPELSRLMAHISIPPCEIERAVLEKGFVTILEPAAGAGGMILEAAQVIREMGHDPSRVMRATLVDRSPHAFEMSYVQCHLAGIPAQVFLGDALADPSMSDARDMAVTPALVDQVMTMKAREAEPLVQHVLLNQGKMTGIFGK